jgi:hypothetical protein
MRQFLTITFLLPIWLFGQSKHSLTLELSTGDCRKNESVRIGFQDTIRFYQNGKLYKQIIPMRYTQWPIEIENFKPGTYSVTFKNLYGQKVTKTVAIPDSSEYELELCPDLLETYPKNTLPSLQNGETIKINFYSQGCFHSDKEILTISKKNDLISAQLQSNGKTKSITLNSSQIEAFKRFENELRILKDSYGCTTTDTYLVTGKNLSLKRTDGSCAWNGFHFLNKAFFGKIE